MLFERPGAHRSTISSSPTSPFSTTTTDYATSSHVPHVLASLLLEGSGDIRIRRTRPPPLTSKLTPSNTLVKRQSRSRLVPKTLKFAPVDPFFQLSLVKVKPRETPLFVHTQMCKHTPTSLDGLPRTIAPSTSSMTERFEISSLPAGLILLFLDEPRLCAISHIHMSNVRKGLAICFW
jgi:hypothetical protein